MAGGETCNVFETFAYTTEDMDILRKIVSDFNKYQLVVIKLKKKHIF